MSRHTLPPLPPSLAALAPMFVTGCLVVMICLSAPASPVHAQQRGEKVFSGETRVTVVEVPVHVTDRAGAPIRDLRTEDFEVFDEGTRQTITDFEVVDLDILEPAGPTPQSYELPSAARRHILLLFDISFSNPTSILRARQAARDFVLRQLHPADLVGVATYSLEYGPRLVLTFTTDRAQVAHAVDSLGLHSRVDIDPLRFIIEPRNQAGLDSSTQNNNNNLPDLTAGTRGALLELLQIMSEQLDKNEKSFQRSQIAAFARSLGEMARILGSVAGRKHVVLFSEGFDSRLVTGDPLGPVAGGDPRSLRIEQGDAWRIESDDLYGNSGLQRKLGEMVREFRRADCVIQAVDIGGLRAEGDIESSGPNGTGSLNIGQEGLFYMANETGGELFKDANNIEGQLGEMLHRTSLTYVLSFQPEKLRADGRFHRLRVRLNNEDLRGARLSYRQGYYAPRPFEELHPMEKELLAANAIATGNQSAELEMDVLVAPFRATEQWAYVPVILEVDGPSLLAGYEGKEVGVEIYAYATDSEGQMQGFFTHRLRLDLGSERGFLKQRGLKYYGHLELPPGKYQIRVLVRNASTGRATVEVLPLTVPEYEKQQTVVLPPFFLENPGEWLMTKEQVDGQRPDSMIYPFTVKGEPYIPAARPTLDSGEDASFCLVAYNLNEGAVQLAGEVKTRDGRPVVGGRLRLLERTTTGIAGYDKLLARFETEGLAAGEYTLHVALTDPSTGHSQSNSILFSVRN